MKMEKAQAFIQIKKGEADSKANKKGRRKEKDERKDTHHPFSLVDQLPTVFLTLADQRLGH